MEILLVQTAGQDGDGCQEKTKYRLVLIIQSEGINSVGLLLLLSVGHFLADG